MSKRKAGPQADALVRCSTRALKNARHLQAVAPEVIPKAGGAEGFGTGIPLVTLAQLHHLPADHPDLQPFPKLQAFLRSNRLPLPQLHSRGPLFSGTLHFVKVTFNTPSGSFAVSDADMSTIVQYAQHAAVPISEYATQYGSNSVSVAPGFLRFTATGASFGDSDVQGWANSIAAANGFPATDCIAFPVPNGVNAGVGGNSGYHGKATGSVYTIFGVFVSGITLQDLVDQYAMVVSHEMAELVVDPNVDGSNPEVCDPCDINCGPLHRDYFDASNHYLGSTANLPPPYAFAYYICAVVQPGSATSCPAPDGSCNYAPPKTKVEKFEGKELKDHKFEKYEHKDFKIEKIEVKDFKFEKHEKLEIKDWKEVKFEKHEKVEIIEHKPPKLEFDQYKITPELPPGPGPLYPPEIAGMQQAAGQMQHFITPAQRPDMSQGALLREPDAPAAPRKRATTPRRSGGTGKRRTTATPKTRRPRRS